MLTRIVGSPLVEKAEPLAGWSAYDHISFGYDHFWVCENIYNVPDGAMIAEIRVVSLSRVLIHVVRPNGLESRF